MSAEPMEAATTGAVGELGPHLRRSYGDELALLPLTYASATQRDQSGLAAQRQSLASRPAVFVGSGGAHAVAVLGRDLHQSRTGRMSQALTSLDLIGAPPTAGTAVVLISAGARHPDTAAAAAAALRTGAGPVLLLTERDPAEFTGALTDPRLVVVSLPREHDRDGFLATNSVLNLATALVRLYDGDRRLPKSLPSLAGRAVTSGLPPGGRALVLAGPGVGPAAVDLETRLSETGLAAVQLTDYRNFAHGRHYGLSKNIDETTVVALVAPALAPLADATLATLPTAVRVIRLETPLDGAAGTLDLLCASMRLMGVTATAAGLDPARPSVPDFGRRLYHLRSGRLFPPPPAEIVTRKETEAGLRSASPSVRKAFSAAFAQWSQALAEARFGAIVMDYDGTVCRTEDRFSLPEPTVRARLTDLLESGLVLGFASGRGGSLPEDLRKWIPESRWSAVHLALYNGGRCLRLDDEALGRPPASTSGPSAGRKAAAGDDPFRRPATAPELRPVLAGLRAHPLGRFLTVTARPAQISVSAAPGSGLPQASVSELVRQVIQTTVLDDGSPCRVKNVSSGHSEDIVLAGVSKASLVRSLEQLTGRDVLAVGDQGQVGGNDFELLALRQHTLSVDRSSSDPTRCWNLSRDGRSGPALLAGYLGALRRSRAGFRFVWEQ